jgi:hypothetical protein
MTSAGGGVDEVTGQSTKFRFRSSRNASHTRFVGHIRGSSRTLAQPSIRRCAYRRNTRDERQRAIDPGGHDHATPGDQESRLCPVDL